MRSGEPCLRHWYASGRADILGGWPPALPVGSFNSIQLHLKVRRIHVPPPPILHKEPEIPAGGRLGREHQQCRRVPVGDRPRLAAAQRNRRAMVARNQYSTTTANQRTTRRRLT